MNQDSQKLTVSDQVIKEFEESYMKGRPETLYKSHSADFDLHVRLLRRSKEIELTQYVPGEPERDTVILSYKEWQEINQAIRERVKL